MQKLSLKKQLPQTLLGTEIPFICVHMHFRMKEKYFSAGWHNEFHNSIVLMHEIAFTPPISTFAELFRSKIGHTHEIPRQSQAI